MSLDWDLDKIENSDEVCWRDAYPDSKTEEQGERYMKVTTETMIWASFDTGIGNITEANWRKVYLRINFCERLFGGKRNKRNEETEKWEKIFFTPEEVKQHIGLHTNTGNETDAKWRKRMLLHFERDIESRINRFERDAAKATTNNDGDDNAE